MYALTLWTNSSRILLSDSSKTGSPAAASERLWRSCRAGNSAPSCLGNSPMPDTSTSAAGGLIPLRRSPIVRAAGRTYSIRTPSRRREGRSDTVVPAALSHQAVGFLLEARSQWFSFGSSRTRWTRQSEADPCRDPTRTLTCVLTLPKYRPRPGPVVAPLVSRGPITVPGSSDSGIRRPRRPDAGEVRPQTAGGRRNGAESPFSAFSGLFSRIETIVVSIFAVLPVIDEDTGHAGSPKTRPIQTFPRLRLPVQAPYPRNRRTLRGRSHRVSVLRSHRVSSPTMARRRRRVENGRSPTLSLRGR